MILHEDKKVFIDAIRITSDYYGTREIFVEKDYWATYLLKKLSQSDFKDKVVFKGGTSLSKAYDLINRFSEDEDILKFDEPKNWRGSKMKDSPLITHFSNIWDHLSPIYERELGGLVYGSLISHKLIHERTNYIINKIADY